MAKKITIMRKRPGEAPAFVEIENTLEALQHEVGGYIEPFTIMKDLTILCNDEGKIIGLPYNCKLFGEVFVGTILFVGVRGEHFTNVPMDEKKAKRLFPSLWSGMPEKTGGG